MEYNLESKLPNEWNLWYHKNKNDWSIKGFQKIYNIKTIQDFWDLNNSWDKNGGVCYQQYFLMKNNIQPIREDKANKNGGRWSFKVKENIAQDLWEDLSSYLVSGNLENNYNGINGLSLTRKKNGWFVIKIWNTNTKDSSLKNLNYNIFKKWGLDVIYIANI